MKWIIRIFQGLLVVAFILTGVMKLTGNAEQSQLFTEAFGYSLGFMYFVGACEVLGAIGLLVGFWKPRIALLVSGGLVLLMAGAVFSHLQAGQGIGTAIPSFILLIIGLVIFIGKRNKSLKKLG
ncbi:MULTISPECIES: DoxX family protein [Paenibacillus]|jgi:putative oxidoreductase|uniref:DoxX family protein n=1 Tax=Paenibacillus baimaensis TaxID=2982185 RepID=A0ABT2UE53_9BACL|nr:MULTISPECIES: DoxX family protein [unclassified Paenibacillus]MCU6792923.1 DoxX family protein [Paenibacillus sp. WQ 127069]OMF13074.1 hypothetical protein BK127_20995 [Paenibacillus sp. FSL H7-0331]